MHEKTRKGISLTNESKVDGVVLGLRLSFCWRSQDIRRKCFDRDWVAGSWVGEGEEAGVEVVADVTGERGTFSRDERFWDAADVVEGVADKGMPCGGCVDADLVRSAGDDRYVQECLVLG